CSLFLRSSPEPFWGWGPGPRRRPPSSPLLPRAFPKPKAMARRAPEMPLPRASFRSRESRAGSSRPDDGLLRLLAHPSSNPACDDLQGSESFRLLLALLQRLLKLLQAFFQKGALVLGSKLHGLFLRVHRLSMEAILAISLGQRIENVGSFRAQ